MEEEVEVLGAVACVCHQREAGRDNGLSSAPHTPHGRNGGSAPTLFWIRPPPCRHPPTPPGEGPSDLAPVA